MNEIALRSFLEELEAVEKTAGIGLLRSAGRMIGSRAMGVGRWAGNQPKQFLEAGKRMLTPHKSIPAGWRNMSPMQEMKRLRYAGKNKELAEYAQKAGRHISEGARSKYLPGRVAESLSRHGWTGKGNISKYTPVGGKGLTAGFAAMSAPSIIEAAKRKPTATGEGGAGELGLGELLGTGAFIAGTGGLGMLPATAMYIGASGLGSRAGRLIDRLRGGANLDTAANAPSPQEAQGMLNQMEGQNPEEQQETINTLRKYYGS